MKAGDIAICSAGSIGMLTASEPREVIYPDGNKGIAYVGVHLSGKIAPIGSPWSSRSPKPVGHISQFIPDIFQEK